MSLDAIVISNFGTESLSGSHGHRLVVDGRIADIQTVKHLMRNGGITKGDIEGSDSDCWACAPTLNGVALYSALTSQGLNVALVDNYHADTARFLTLLDDKPAAIVLSTTFILSVRQLTKAVAEIRKQAPNAFIISGGPFVYQSWLIKQRSADPLYNSPEIKKQYLFVNDEPPEIDCLVVSRYGDDELCQVLVALARKTTLTSIPNLALPTPSGYQFTAPAALPSVLGDSGIDWDRLPDSIFASGVITLQGSFGCPFNCAFCNFPKDKATNRTKTVDQIIAEMKAVARRGIRYVWFVDDNFMLGKKDLNPVFQRIIDEGLHLEWMSLFRADALRNVDHALMRRAGCREVCLGLESADPHVLRNMNKRATPEMYEEVIGKLLAAGINCSGFLVVGFPGETPQTMERTRAFIRRVVETDLPGYAQWSLYPFYLAPLSPIFEADARAQYHLVGGWDEWRHESMTADEARKEVANTLMAMPNCGTIYRSDNQDMLDPISPRQRRRFFAVRHGFAVAAQKGLLDRDVLVSGFRAALTDA